MSERSRRGSSPHDHDFDEGNPLAERRTRWVVILTAITMVIELVAGWWYGSMALLADGWHMSSHVIALGLSVAAYALARRLRRDARFAFGTWKIEVLGRLHQRTAAGGRGAGDGLRMREQTHAPAAHCL